MSPPTWEVEHYVGGNGRCPVQEFLSTLQKNELVRVINRIDQLERLGQELDRPHSEYLRDGIHALRVKVRRVNVRVLYFFCFENRFVLTHGIKKKSDKVQDSQIDKAIECRTDYLARKAKEERR